ncbi:MAG: Asparagine synthase (Glutamine-hydrolyzing) [Candidatus Roizmanbacteria bacterium GW2011_GWA2_35_19]|uniref:asparagine synthase (glutamine-hydrolyzing) n=2 Tax=Candidatus Roizmaniibacteriota TaxID=1752723 RepID=A0A0G0EDX2_9BACT|nr:MAG: Asparagine synthase (Glutamine-hydrolyzing) [Candidatus Roizmanbacteria bacterium GW2011_GWC2_35_12]KKP73460.1 MAG: Asparagine synthase (Glutamine-hydrolyzing) [Candidatus Roizmanbacteria bacterium GW2011_GWA2_35_19]
MCGIAGFYGFSDEKLIKNISEQLKHRGPDGEGYYRGENITLLNRRLAIIDVKGGDQPIFNEDKSIVVVYNGEIYNYLELQQELVRRGHKFSTKSDTEVIIHGYEEWGNQSFDKLNGMFAIALYDIKKEKLILVRDQFGIKPLYYSLLKSKEDSFIFSSEIRPIFHSGLVKKQPNDRIIYRYLKYRIHDDQKETFFKDIFRVMPGEVIEIRNPKSEIQNPKQIQNLNIEYQKYSKLEEDLLSLHDLGGRGESVETFQKELIKAIKYRLISEVPVGTCLSGGLDSSTVVSVVNRLLKDRVKEAESVGKIQKTFSAVFPGGANDEEKYIDELKKQISPLRQSFPLRQDFGGQVEGQANLKSYKIYPKPEEFFKDLEDFVRTQEEPTISTGPYAQYKVMQRAHKEVTVLLDGQGADEMMAGYLPYYFVYLRQLWKTKKYLTFFKETILARDVVIKYIKEKFTKTISSAELMNADFVKTYLAEKFKVENDNLKKRLVEDIFKNSLQSLLRYEDKNAMRFSIEGRVPFLDFNLLKYLFSLPDEAIIKDGWNKYILRKATEDLLPELINKRRNKIGFTTPEYEWFMRMKNKIYMIFSSKEFGGRKYFNQNSILAAFQDFIEGKTTDTMIFWRFLNVELWLREFFDSRKVYKVVKSIKSDFKPNKGKKIEIKVGNEKYDRYPIKTELFKKGDDYEKKITEIVRKLFDPSLGQLRFLTQGQKEKKWFIVVSEKVIAIAQGRSYFIWDIRPSFFAKLLSKYVKKTPFGIGLGSPYTMQLAINEVGLFKISYSAILAYLGKLVGINGLFYRLTGPVVRSIDGPTEYSLYPSNVSAKLGPKNPQLVAENIKSQSASWRTNNKSISNFLGAVIIDANDLGRNVLGNSTGLSDKLVEEIMRDNPMGQSNEQTPIVLVREY